MAALAILGTILVGTVLAKARHTRQMALSQRRLAAVRAADELIAGWWASPQGLPLEQSGATSPPDGFRWSTRLVDNPPLAELGVRVVRVEVGPAEPAAGEPHGPGEPLVAVELVVPGPEPADGQSGAAGPGRRGREGGVP